MTTKSKAIIGELHQIEKRGVLLPRAVVDYARNPRSALHGLFEWDDSDAADKFRLHQARQLIRVYSVRELNRDEPDLKRVYVSLSGERKEGGYRKLSAIFNDADMTAMLLQDALDDLQTFKRKYARLKELASVFVAIDEVLPLKKKRAA